MNEQPVFRTCPKCESSNYMFGGCKKIGAGEGQEAAVEMKYACQACGHEWRVRVPARE